MMDYQFQGNNTQIKKINYKNDYLNIMKKLLVNLCKKLL